MPLVRQIYAVAAEEARAVGIHILSTLVLELDRDPRMGRNMEAYTEDPSVYSQIAKNIVVGAQGKNINAPDKVVALMTACRRRANPRAAWSEERNRTFRAESSREFLGALGLCLQCWCTRRDGRLSGNRRCAGTLVAEMEYRRASSRTGFQGDRPKQGRWIRFRNL